MRNVCLVLLLLATATLGHAAAECPPSWSYSGPNGPDFWGQHYPTCNGAKQSPIDLVGAVQGGPTLQISYGRLQQPGRPVRMENKKFDVDTYNANSSNHIIFAGKRYDLIRFHLHAPSEHKFSGTARAMEIHFVNEPHPGGGGTGAVAIGVTVRVVAQDNPEIQKLLDAWPHAECTTRTTDNFQLELARLLPPSRHAYAYSGSLTTPGCNEPVEWFVMDQPITASQRQVDAILAWFGQTARPLQLLNGRRIWHR